MSPIPADLLVSVILPVHNGADYVGIALDSVLTQTHQNLEIIAVDDGSTDDTLKILENYAARDARVHVFTQPNSGVARARNRAIAEARSEFIAPLDADDLWQPTKIARQLQRLTEAGEETGFVYSWWVWIDSNGAVLDRSPRWTIEGGVFERLLQVNFIGNASVPLLRKHCVKEVGGYNEELNAANAGGCEDWELVLRVAERYRVAVVPEVLLGYRRRPGSMSTSCYTMWRSQQAVMQKMRELRPGLNPQVLRRSDQQFSFYLAGLSFWSGNFYATLRWALRSGLRLPLIVSPYAARILLNRHRRKQRSQTMLPGVSIDVNNLPEPLLPYHKFRMIGSS
jgi:glycosyltransferase involved in cell wall biosynthesis